MNSGLNGATARANSIADADAECLPHLESDIEIRAAAFANRFHFRDQAPQTLRLRAAFRKHPFDAGPALRAGFGGQIRQAIRRSRREFLAPMAVVHAHRFGLGRAPVSRQMGSPRRLPSMSHSAISTAASAVISTGPLR